MKKVSKMLMVLFLMLLIVSCNENNDTLINNEHNSDNFNLDKTHPVGFSIDNSNNIYDYVGVLHNEILGEHMLQTEGRNLTIEEIKASIESIAMNNQDFVNILGEDDFLVTDNNLINDAIKDYENNYFNLIDSTSLGLDGKNKLKSLLTYIDTFEGTYYDYVDGLKEFEESIILDNKLSVEEKGVVLMTSSTARHSFDFWFEFLRNNGVDIDYDEPIQEKSGKGFFGQLLIIVGGDAIGAGLGGIFGGPPGAAAIGLVFSGTAASMIYI